MSLGVGIIGCGLIGRKRAAALGSDRLVACADLDSARASELAATSGASVVSVEDLVRHPGIDVVIVATTNDALAGLTVAALNSGKDVLVEKPAARCVSELDAATDAADRNSRLVRVGFNHRYHPALQQARRLVDSGVLGPMMFLRGRYGHGGRLGYEREWRADPSRSGGGELIDQGVHLIDLARWFLGELVGVEGHAATFFWNMPVDDNAFLTLQTASGQTAFLHVSCTEWKNLFSLEIYGRVGKIAIDGLGGSYGVERLTYYRMLPQMGPPEAEASEYPGPDSSWSAEWSEFVADIQQRRMPSAGLADARAALTIVEQIYSRSGFRPGQR